MRRRICGAAISAAAALSLAWAPTVEASGIQEKLDRAEKKIESDQKKEGVLTSRLDRLGTRVDAMQEAVDALREAEADAAERLASAEAELGIAIERLDSSLAKLRKTRRKLKASLRVLRERIVDIYVSGSPNLASVVLAAGEYGDLVELGPYLEAIQSRDESIVNRVRVLKKQARVIVDARRNAKETIKASRDRIAAERDRLQGARSETENQVASLDSARSASQAALDEVRGQIAQEEDVAAGLREKLAKEIGAITAPTLPAGPGSAPSSTGSMIWPIDGTLTSPFGPRWGRTHEGLDIAGPEGTPIVAAASGTVVLMQSEAESGGYGLFTCVDHGGGLSTCYAHQSSFGTSVGASVKQGEVIGYVGNTGNSFGAHVHFEVRLNGAATDPMAYL